MRSVLVSSASANLTAGCLRLRAVSAIRTAQPYVTYAAEVVSVDLQLYCMILKLDESLVHAIDLGHFTFFDNKPSGIYGRIRRT